MAIGFNTSSTGIGLQPTLNGDAGLNQPTLTLEQSQSVSEQTATGPIAYTPPIFSQCQVNQNLTTSAATGYAGVGLNPNAGEQELISPRLQASQPPLAELLQHPLRQICQGLVP